MNAYGKVEARIVISEAGQVIEATAISWRPALRSAAVDAAREWVYKPKTLNGIPTEVETVLTFTITPGSQQHKFNHAFLSISYAFSAREVFTLTLSVGLLLCVLSATTPGQAPQSNRLALLANSSAASSLAMRESMR